MKFTTGIALGFAAGYLAASKASEQTRAQVNDLVERVRQNPRVQQATDTVTRDARKLGDAVQDRVRSVADRGTDAVADKVEPSSAASGKSSTGNAKSA
jgi:hypothetical protein